MVMTHELRIKITKSQHEKIIQNAQTKGYATVSDYIRNLALDKEEMIGAKIIETNKLVKDVLEAVNGKGI